MSEYQTVKFRAIDQPLTDKQLDFMDRQSSRARFSQWEFEVEYHYSSFRGDVDGMLRHGYDIYLTYSHYGCREIRMRLPNGLPFRKSVCSKYINVEGIKWIADKKGKAGILSVAPNLEEAYEDDCELDDYLDATATLRGLLIAGDLRALYVLWLCCALDSNDDLDKLMEPPIPHGLAALPNQAKDLLTFFTVDPLLVDAAAFGIPNFDSQRSQADSVGFWLTSIADSRQAEIIQRLLSEDPFALKCELLSEIRDSQQAVEWPAEPPHRTIVQLLETCESLRQKKNEKLRASLRPKPSGRLTGLRSNGEQE